MQTAAKVAIFFVTKHGHTRKIAERLAKSMASLRVVVDLFDIGNALPAVAAMQRANAVVICGSVHFGRHHARLERFVRGSLPLLTKKQSVFVSVSGQAATDEPNESSLYVEEFVKRTGWQPQRIARFAGAIAYRRYNPLLRFVMRRIAAHRGLSVDTSRDHEYTNWNAVDALAREIAVQCAASVTCSIHEPDAKGATERDVRRIIAIDSLDSLGYIGEGREEHSGENAPRTFESLEEELADNRAGQAVPSGR